MIKSEVNKGKVTLTQVEGTGLTIMSELCCLVKAVCTEFFADEEDGEELTSIMILRIAHALNSGEVVKWGADIEDDENADIEDDENTDALIHHEDLIQGEKLEDDENADF